MKIEYIYHNNDDEDIQKQLRQIRKENTIGCLMMTLFLLITLFVILSLLPVLLIIIGWSIVFIGCYVIYKIYLESAVLNFIQKMKMRK